MDMLTFTFDQKRRSPLYHQLYEYIKTEIRAGRILHDAKLPSKRKLSAYLKISLNTIQTAYDQLIEEGYVVPVPKKGFFVCPMDHILNLEIKEIAQPGATDWDEQRLMYDFSYQGVDHASFPYAVWRKLTKEAIDEYDEDLLKPGSSQGNEKLRASLAEYLRQSRGVHCTADEIIVSSGTESLYQILIQLLGHDQVYGIENPGYEKLNLLFKSNNARFKTINIDANGMMMDEIENSGADILCITPAHQFPSGHIMPISRRIKILNWAREFDHRYVVEDDYDSEFKYSGKPVPALQGLDPFGRVIYMGSLSKSLSPSMRVSYMVLPEELLARYKESLSFIVCPVPSIEQKVLQKFIQDGHFERHINKMRSLYKKKRELLVGEISKSSSRIKVLGADAGLHLLVQVANGMSEAELVGKALAAGIGVYGVSKYYHETGCRDCVPTVLLGYASVMEGDIATAVGMLVDAWL